MPPCVNGECINHRDGHRPLSKVPLACATLKEFGWFGTEDVVRFVLLGKGNRVRTKSPLSRNNMCCHFKDFDFRMPCFGTRGAVLIHRQEEFNPVKL